LLLCCQNTGFQAEDSIWRSSEYLQYGDRCGGCRSLGDLLRRLLNGSLLRRHFHWSLLPPLSLRGLLRSTPLCHGWLLRGLRGMESSPALLCSFNYGSFASGTELPFWGFGRGGWLRLRLGWLLGFSPPFPLCITDAFPGGCTQLSPFAFWTFRCSGWFRTATREHGPEFGNLSVDAQLLLFKTFDGGSQDFRSKLLCRHVNQSNSLDDVRRDHCTSATNLPHARRHLRRISA
jgi:hypothetical protein